MMPYGDLNIDRMVTSTPQGVLGAGNASIMKNRIINGAMVIDQRNAGASVTITGSATYSVDRWYAQGVNSAGVFTIQQSTDAPTGFNNSLKATVTTSATPSGINAYRIIQRIEGYNTANLNLGTANAKELTLSFWTKSSITGTFAGSFWGGSATAWFPFSYTINSANTWEYKTISIGAATTTPATAFDTTNGTGLQLTFNIGAGSSVLTTGGSWIYGATEYYGVTGQTNLIATNGATFYITGVQLEVGSSATGYEYRMYGQELALCQRYYVKLIDPTGNANTLGVVEIDNPSLATGTLAFPMRATPTSTFSGITISDGSVVPSLTSVSALASLTNGISFSLNCSAGTLTTGRAGRIRIGGSTTAYLDFSAEL